MTERLIVHLDRYEGDELGTLHAVTLPFLVGNDKADVAWQCGSCNADLASGLHPKQVLDLLVICGRCEALLRTPIRVPGSPIAGRPVYVPPHGIYRLEGQLDVVDKPVMMVGRDALVGYARETGRSLPEMYEPESWSFDALDEKSFIDLGDRLRALVGDDYQRLVEADARGRASPTPPPRRARMMELIEFADVTATMFRERKDPSRPEVIDGDLLAESITAGVFADRWRHHPAWPQLAKTFGADEASHTIMLLAVAGYLVDNHNGVGLYVDERSGQPVADMWLEPTLEQRVDVEVKTPLALRAPLDPLTPDRAAELVGRALKKSGKQRKNTGSSVLVIGGYHLSQSFAVMLTAVARVLRGEQRKHRGLSGVLVVDCTFTVGSSAEAFAPILRVEFAPHPGYSGGITVDSRDPAVRPIGEIGG